MGIAIMPGHAIRFFLNKRSYTAGYKYLKDITNLIFPLIGDGNKVVEVRMSGYDKGVIALRIVNETKPDFILCIGDDTTDEDMFKALDGKAYTIKVSNASTAAKYTVLSQQKVLPLLNQLVQPLTKNLYAAT